MAQHFRRLVIVGALFGAALVTIVQSQNGFRGINGDFVARYAGGAVVADGGSPYDDERLFAQARALGDPGGLPMYDAPPVAAVFRVVSVLPLRVASMGLELASLGSCAFLARLLTRTRPWAHTGAALAALLVFSPVKHTLSLGQIDLVVLALVVAFGRAQPVLAVGKPQTTGLVALACASDRGGRPWARVALVAAAGVLVTVVLTELVAPNATWSGWWEHLGERSQGGRPWWGFALAAAGLVLVAVARRSGPVDRLAVAGAATGLLAASGGWNPQWFLALALPLGAIALAVADGVRLRRLDAALLALVVTASAGDAFVAYSAQGDFHIWVPVAGFACLLVAAVVQGLVSPIVAVAMVLGNAAITAAVLSATDRVAVSMLVAVALLHLTFSVRAAPIAGGGPRTA